MSILMQLLKVVLLTGMGIMTEWCFVPYSTGVDMKIAAFVRDDDDGRKPFHVLYNSCPCINMNMLKLVLKNNLEMSLCQDDKRMYIVAVAVKNNTLII